MKCCRREWLLSLCIISIQLLTPPVFEGLLVGAQGLPPPALTPPLVKQVDELVSIFRVIFLHFSRFIYFNFSHG
jgi:hypothetical protein